MTEVSIKATIVPSPAAQKVFRRIQRNRKLHADIKAIARADHRQRGN